MLELRVGALLVLGSYLYCLVIHVLAQFNINVFHAFGYQENLSSAVRSIANLMLACWVVGTALFGLQIWIFPGSETRIICLLTLLALAGILIYQKALRSMLPRIIKGGISEDYRLGDILLSDALVSMASILSDFVYSISLTWYGVPASHPLNRPEHIGFGILLVACLPQGIRIKQCVIDFRRSRDKSHLMNLLKYVVANGPHAIRLQMAVLNPQIDVEKLARDHLSKVLLVSLTLNAFFSLTWDLMIDWKLLRLKIQRQSVLLRFPKGWYYTAAVADLVLRFSFLLANNTEHIVFACQVLEFCRRAMWAVFRVESEPLEMTDEIELQYTSRMN